MGHVTQLDIFGNHNIKRIYKRDAKGRFSSLVMSNEEKLFRENNRLKLEVETWRRKTEELTKLIGHSNLTTL